MIRRLQHILISAAAVFLTAACMDYGPMESESLNLSPRGVYITCEGNFCYGNATLSYYLPDERRVENEVFARANGINLGDVAQSMFIHEGRGYVVVNNSGVIYVVDPRTCQIEGSITGFTSPRRMHFISGTNKAYVTDLYDPHLAVVDLSTRRIVQRIATNGHRSTEQMVQIGDELWVSCWSYDNRILIFDMRSDVLVDSISVPNQPSSLEVDRHGKLWALTDEGISRIDPATRRVEQTFTPEQRPATASLAINGTRDTLYYIAGDVWRMPVVSDHLPYVPFVPENGTRYYALAIDPLTSEVYLADAIDYVQPGMIYRYSPKGAELDRFRTGITPGSFCFKTANTQ